MKLKELKKLGEVKGVKDNSLFNERTCCKISVHKAFVFNSLVSFANINSFDFLNFKRV